MRRIIGLTPEQDQSIIRLVEEGKYQNFHHFLSAAVDNQLVLEDTASGELLPAGTDHYGVRTARPVTGGRSEPVELAQIATAPPLAEGELNGGNNPDRWLWGQINS